MEDYARAIAVEDYAGAITMEDYARAIAVEDYAGAVTVEDYAEAIAVEDYAGAITVEDYAEAIAVEDYAGAITVEDYAEAIAVEDYAGAITVEDYAKAIAVEDYAEDVLLVQRAIAASMVSSVHNIVDVDFMADVDIEVVEDRKGRAIKTYSGKTRRGCFTPSIVELGESSSNRGLDHPSPTGTPPPPLPLLSTALCAICMEDKPLSECSTMKGCNHLFCSDCISKYVAAKVQENVTAIKCPQPDCKDGSLEPETCHAILPVEVFDQWCTALCEALFVGEVRFYCPFKDCSALLIDEPGSGSAGEKVNVITHAECPHCHRLFCAQCKVPWHAGVACDVFQSLGTDERGREDIVLMEMAKKSKWQRCPKCKFYVERTEGCMFMQCRCGFRFCYGCASPMIIDHYCTQCRR